MMFHKYQISRRLYVTPLLAMSVFCLTSGFAVGDEALCFSDSEITGVSPTCPNPPNGKCTTQTCSVDYVEVQQILVDIEFDDDGNPVEYHYEYRNVTHYKCVGKVGYYESEAEPPTCKDIADIAKPGLEYFGARTESSFDCFLRAGCPTSGCTEITDPETPSNTIAICADGPQEPQSFPGGQILVYECENPKICVPEVEEESSQNEPPVDSGDDGET